MQVKSTISRKLCGEWGEGLYGHSPFQTFSTMDIGFKKVKHIIVRLFLFPLKQKVKQDLKSSTMSSMWFIGVIGTT